VTEKEWSRFKRMFSNESEPLATKLYQQQTKPLAPATPIEAGSHYQALPVIQRLRQRS